MIASWHDMTWECSPREITRLENLTTSYAIETKSNADKDGKSPTETVGFADEEISLATTYRIETGTSDIRGMIDKWKSLVGKAAPLILGSDVFGPDKVQLQSVSVSNIVMRANGVLTAATLSFKFKEFNEKQSNAVTTTTKNSGTKQTAVNVTASKADKKSKKNKSMRFETSRKEEIM